MLRRLAACGGRCAFVVLLAVTGCMGQRQDAVERGRGAVATARWASPVASSSVAQVEMYETETVLAPSHMVDICAQSDGLIAVLWGREGQRVGAGDLLGRLDDAEQRAGLDERAAVLARAEVAELRARRLRDSAMVSQEQYATVDCEWQVARAEYERARSECGRCEIRSPIAGIVERRRVDVGAFVRVGEVLFRVLDPDTLRAELLLPETLLMQVRVGRRARVLPRATGVPVWGTVARVGPGIDLLTGKVRAVVLVDNRGGWAPVGGSARVELDLSVVPEHGALVAARVRRDTAKGEDR